MAIKVPNLNNSKLSYGNFPLFNAVGGLSAYKIGSYRPQLNIDFSNDTFTSANKNLGPELVTNGTFDSDSDWTLGTGWSISGGSANYDNSVGFNQIYQDIGLSEGGLYEIVFDLTVTSGALSRVRAGGLSSSEDIGGPYISPQTVSLFFVCPGSTGEISFVAASGAFVGSIDNISVREVVSYSPASTTAASLLTHTRAGTATYTDSTGTLQTAASGELRKDNHIWDGSSWVKRCLVEPQSTNLVTYSEDFTDASWLKANVGVTSNSTTSPDGSINASLLSYTGTGSPGTFYQDRASTVTETSTIYIKAKDVNFVQFRPSQGGASLTNPIFDLRDGTVNAFSVSGVVNAYATNAGDGWYRITVVTDGSSTERFGLTPMNDASTITTSAADCFYIYGAQLEASSVPTSYIPTAGSQVTRPADALSIDSTLLPYDSTAMTIVMDGEMTYADTNATLPNVPVSGELTFFAYSVDNDNYIASNLHTGSTRTGSVHFRQENGSVLDEVSEFNAYSPGTNVPFNIASRHTSSDINGAVDGTALTADTTPTALPNLSATDFEIAPTGVINIKSLRILGGYGATDAELEAATT